MTMEERHRDDGFEATFVVSTPRAEAWKRLRDAEPVDDLLPAARDDQWWIPGIEGAADEIDVVEEERLHVRKATFPCKGTEIVIVMEDEATGTRITFCQYGFDDFGRMRRVFELGWWAIRADLYVYFEHGVSPGRHLAPWNGIGCETIESPGGLVVGGVQPDSCAERIGLQKGDLLLNVNGSPVLTTRDITTLLRGPIGAGVGVEIRYLRDVEIRTGAATA
jgi:hypothetical protein